MSLEFSAEEFGNEFAANFEYEPPPAHFQDSRSVLGRGSFGTTYRMNFKPDGRKFAVKMIQLSVAQEVGVTVQAVEKEIQFLMELQHPNIVSYFLSYKCKQYDSIFFNIAMELVEGGSIASIMIEFNRTISEIADWLQQTASALSYARQEDPPPRLEASQYTAHPTPHSEAHRLGPWCGDWVENGSN